MLETMKTARRRMRTRLAGAEQQQFLELLILLHVIVVLRVEVTRTLLLLDLLRGHFARTTAWA